MLLTHRRPGHALECDDPTLEEDGWLTGACSEPCSQSTDCWTPGRPWREVGSPVCNTHSVQGSTGAPGYESAAGAVLMENATGVGPIGSARPHPFQSPRASPPSDWYWWSGWCSGWYPNVITGHFDWKPRPRLLVWKRLTTGACSLWCAGRQPAGTRGRDLRATRTDLVRERA